MATANQVIDSGHVQMGQNGKLLAWGSANFVTTSTAGTLTIPFPAGIAYHVGFTPVAGTLAGDEEIFITDALVAGRYKLSSNGVLNIGRTGASPTSGLVFTFFAIGE